MNVFDTLLQAARQWPSRTAIIDAEGSLDYQTLWRQIEALRAELASANLRQGTGVGIRARNGRGFVIGALAALGCGGVIMPIHHQLKPFELEQMLKQAPLGLILDDGCGCGLPPSTRARSPLRAVKGLHLTPLADPNARLAPGIEQAAFVRFTSGTTGAAKGVALTHQDILERIHAANSGLGLGAGDSVLWVLPMAYHFYVSILLYLEVGATIIVSADYLAESILEAAETYQATFLYVTPMHVRILTGADAKYRLPASLKRVMSVSSRLHPQAARDFQARYGVPVAQGYGIIEVGLPIMNIEEAADHPEAIGRPLKDFEAALLDEHQVPVADGQTGQLALRGPGMLSGYLCPPRRREEVLKQGWFLTGDLAHRDPGGRIVLDGRVSSVINVAGHKVFPEEVAGVLDQHPAVLRSRVAAQPHPQLGEVVHAQVQLRGGAAPVTCGELRTFCSRALSSHKVPASIEFVEQLEMTASGKVRHG
jgi:acyl-CoA synthetase (AMP-forming)/AMP-acid ligase II